jgi:hypothetical protein
MKRLIILCLVVLGCASNEEAPLLPIPLDLHQPEKTVLDRLDSMGFKNMEYIANDRAGDSIPLAGLPGYSTYYFYPDGLWHGVHFRHEDSTFEPFKMLRARFNAMYGTEEELNQQPQIKSGYAVWRPDTGDVRIVRVSSGRGYLQVFIGDSTALAGESQ